MITTFTDRFIAARGRVEAALAVKHPEGYAELVKLVVETITSDDYGQPDPGRITEIDYGDYQGVLVYVIAATGYQPSNFWYVRVSYGSCSGCDTLQAISGYDSEPPTASQISQYWTLCLHIAQGIGAMQGDEA